MDERTKQKWIAMGMLGVGFGLAATALTPSLRKEFEKALKFKEIREGKPIKRTKIKWMDDNDYRLL